MAFAAQNGIMRKFSMIGTNDHRQIQWVKIQGIGATKVDLGEYADMVMHQMQ